MSDQTTAAAAPSAASEDVFNGENVSMAEYDKYRQNGELPDRFKPADSADSATAADISEGDEPEPEGESDPPQKQQEKPAKAKQTAEERIAQLESTIEKIRKGAGIDQTRKAESSPATIPPPNAEQHTRPEPTVDDKQADGSTKYETYEQYIKDLARWEAEQMLATRDREQQQQSQQKELAAKVAEAKQRYGEDFDEVLAPAISAVVNDQRISGAVKAMLNESDVLPDLIYTIGSDSAELAKFIEMAQTNPGKAMRYIALVESGIVEELAGSKANATARNENGQFAANEAPAKPKTSAPKPPTPVSGASKGAFDVSDESLSADEWMRKRNADLKRKG